MRPPTHLRTLAGLVLTASLLAGAASARAAAVTNTATGKTNDATAKGVVGKAGGRAAEPALTNKPPIELVFIKSAFEDKIGTGRDPFFPASLRRNPAPPVPVRPPTPVIPTNAQPGTVTTNTTNEPAATNVVALPIPVVKPKPSVHLSLKGVSLGKVKSVSVFTTVKLYDILQGEKMMVRTPDGPILIQCLEIKARSVILNVDGEEVELKLRTGI